jgi:hypothetical protein
MGRLLSWVSFYCHLSKVDLTNFFRNVIHIVLYILGTRNQVILHRVALYMKCPCECDITQVQL